MNELLGQGDAFPRTLRQAREKTMHHGLLITGLRGVGKTHAAAAIAKALLCAADPEHAPDAACGTCGPCTRFAVHADLHRVEIPADKDEIPVDLVRELRASLGRLPVAGDARAIVVDPADRLNVQGQNALLKTLEEPGRSTFLLLPTRRPEALLETVRSRVAELAILPLDRDTLHRALAERAGAGVSPADLHWAADHSHGSLGLARGLLSEEIRPLFALLEGFVLRRQGTPVGVARAALHRVSGRVPSLERALWTLWILRTILRNQLWTSLASQDAGPYVSATSVPWTAKIESLFEAETDLSQRIPPEQVLAQALLSIHAPSI